MLRQAVDPFDAALADLESLLVDLNGDGRPDAVAQPPGAQAPQMSNAMAIGARRQSPSDGITGGRNAMRPAQSGLGLPNFGPPAGGNAMASSAFPQMVARNPRGWGNAPPAARPVTEQEPWMYQGEISNSNTSPIAETPPPAGGTSPPHRNAMATYRAHMLPYAEYDDGSAGISYPQIVPDTYNAMRKLGRAAESAFGAKHAPQDVMPTAEDAGLISGLAMTGGLALPRPSGSLGAFGRLAKAEELASGRYAELRKPMDWGGASRLAQARTAERRGLSPEEIWEQFGWARQPEPGAPAFNRLASERHGIEPGQWYMEHGSSPRSLGERYDLGIGQRKRVAPWRMDEAPETAFDAPAVFDPQDRFGAPFGESARPPARNVPESETGRAVSAPADSLTTSIRTLEDKMRSEGASNADIAQALDRRFLQKVTPDNLAAGKVWWRMREITGRETGRAAGGRYMPAREMLTPEAEAALKSDAFRDLSNEQAARALKEQFGLSLSRPTVTKVRRELGLDADVAKPVPLPPEAEAALLAPETLPLTNRAAAEMLRQRFGIELSENAVRQRRERRGVAPERRTLDLPPEALKALRSAKYQKWGKRTAARELEKEFGVKISPQSVWTLRLKLGL